MYLQEEAEKRAKAASGENLKRQKLTKLCHSKSDDRRRSFDRFRKESQSISRYSLNSSAAAEGCPPEYEIKYFTAKSLETEDSKADLSDTSRIMDFEDQEGSHLSPEANDALLEEPELENLTEIEAEEFSKIQFVKEKGKSKENTRNLEDAADEIEIYADDNESDYSRDEE